MVSDYICSEIDFPFCRFVSKEVCKGMCRTEMINKTKLNSPALLCLIAIILGLTVRMMRHVQSLCSSIGRREMTLLFTSYSFANIIELVLVGLRHTLDRKLFMILTTLQLVFTNVAFFSLLVGAITMEMYAGKHGYESQTLLYIWISSYGFLSTLVIFVSLLLKTAVPILIMSFGLNLLFAYSYFILQIRKLNFNNAEIWAYGTLFIALACFMLSSIPIFVGSGLIAI
ncbi:glucose/Na cotransporter, partial [Nosema bombycis CQ1]